MNPDNVPPWGCPWHGRVERDEFFDYWLVKTGGARIPLSGRLSEAAAYALYSLGLESTVPGSNLVRVPGHVMPERSAEQLEFDAEQGYEWLGSAMLSGQWHCLHGQNLGPLRWIYSDGHGQVWLMSIAVVSRPVVGGNPAAPLTLRLTARRFGLIGSAAENIDLGEVSAASCLDITPPVGWASLGDPVKAQSIRSDGGALILELCRNSAQPGRIRVSGFGYYKLEVTRAAEGAWSSALSVQAWASEMYSSSAEGHIETQQVAVASVILQAPTPENPDIPWIVQSEVLQGDDEPSGDLWEPYVFYHYDVPTGVIEQQRTVHCGFVYDEFDVLHRVERRLRITHECNVPAIVPSVSGVMTVTVVGDETIYDDQRVTTVEQRQEVASEVVIEVLLEGVVVSAVSTTLTNAIDISYQRIGSVGPADYVLTERGEVDIAGDIIRFDGDDASSSPVGWHSIPNWPPRSGVGEWVTISGGAVAWRPSIDQSVSWCLGHLRFPGHGPITIGALRLANNVWAPVIFCGSTSNGFAWVQETTEGSVSGPVPGALVGPAVGPAGASGVGSGAYPNGTWPHVAIVYDYLHGELVAGHGVF